MRSPLGGRLRHQSPSAVLSFALFVSACGSGTGPDVEIPTVCDPSITTSLEVGESAEYSGLPARLFCVEAGEAAEEFVLVGFSGAPTSTTSLRFVAENTIGVTGPPTPLLAPDAAALGGGFDGDPVPVPDVGFHNALREAERRLLTPLTLGDAGALPFSLPVAGLLVNPAVGDTVTINANGKGSEACTIPLNVGAKVMAVRPSVVVVADTMNPAGGFDTEDYELYADLFEDTLLPIADEYFGEVTDIDGNGRVIVLFTKEVNRLTPAGSNSFVAGFFFSRDLFPKTTSGGLSGCPASNYAELLYLLVPDPGPAPAYGNERTLAFVRRITAATILHEFQHLVNASRRLHVRNLRGSNWNEETWLDEGLAHFAEEVLFFEDAGLSPKGNLTRGTIVSGDPVTDAYNRHQIFNMDRLRLHLQNPTGSSVYGASDGLGRRGAAWSFLRYAADRRAGEPSEFIRQLVNSNTRGLENLSDALGGETILFEWMSDWAVSFYADDRGIPGLPNRYRDLSWNHRSFYGVGTNYLGPSFPLPVTVLASGTPLTRSLVPGGAVYYRFGVDAGTVGQIEVRNPAASVGSSGSIPSENVRITVLRTK